VILQSVEWGRTLVLEGSSATVGAVWADAGVVELRRDADGRRIVTFQFATGFLSVQPGGALEANREEAHAWEEFVEYENADGTVSYRSWQGFLCCEPTPGAETVLRFIANRPAIGPWEKFVRPQPAADLTAWQVSGRRLVTREGEPALWVGLTAFTLLEHIAHGRFTDAEAYVRWARDEGFNVLRVLSMVWWPDLKLTAEEGYEALPHLLRLTARNGMRIELVGLATTSGRTQFPGFDWDYGRGQQHIRDLRDLILRAADDAGVMLQVANEHWHPSQAEWVRDPVHIHALEGEVAGRGFLTTQSAAEHDEWTDPPKGAYITRHLDRGRDCWNMVRRVRELENVSLGTGQFVVNDEPAKPADLNPSDHPWSPESIAFVMGALNRLCNVGGTFHSTAGLRAQVPTGQDLSAARAFIQGMQVVAPARVLRFANAGWPDAPVAEANFAAVVRVYSGYDDQGWATVALGVDGDPAIEWRGPAGQPVPPFDLPGVQVYVG